MPDAGDCKGELALAQLLDSGAHHHIGVRFVNIRHKAASEYALGKHAIHELQGNT